MVRRGNRGGCGTLGSIRFPCGTGGASGAQQHQPAGRARVDGREARYLETGHLLYLRSGTLYAAPFDPVRVEMAGEGVPVRDRIRTGNVVARMSAISETGTLVYAGALSSDRQLILVDLEGRPESLAAPPLPYRMARFSPDDASP